MAKHYLEPMEFILLVGRSLHRYGAAAHHIEAALTGLSGLYCEEGEFFVTPTAIISSIKIDGEWETRLQRVSPGGIDLGRLSKLDEIGDLVTHEMMSMSEGIRRIREIDQDQTEAPYQFILRIIFYVLASLAFGSFMLHRWVDLAVVGGLSFFASCYLELESRFSLMTSMREFVLPLMVSFLAFLTLVSIPDLQVNPVILASLVVLIPGLSITIALSEISSRNWLSGTSRLMGAFAELMKMTFGVVLGTLLAQNLTGLGLPKEIVGSGSLVPEFLVLVIAGLAFSHMFNNLLRDYFWVVLGGTLAFYGAKFGGHYFGNELGVFVGALILAAFSNGYARLKQRPALTILIPGLLPMVPGSIGYKSLNFVFHQDVMGAMSSSFSLMIVAIALVGGLTIGSAIVHPRRSI